MSRNIDVENWQDLGEAEALYAFNRGMLTQEQLDELGYDPARSVTTDKPLQFQPNTGDANTFGKTQKDLDKAQVDDEDLEPLEENLTEPQLQGQEEPKPGPEFDEDSDEDVEDNYDTWTNDELRGEIYTRNDEQGKDLSPEGKKAQLIDTLRADDRA